MFRRIFTRPFIAAAAALLAPPLFCQDPKREVYIWGNGVYQARPDALLQFKNFTPKKIQNLPHDLVYLAFGEYFEAGIDSKNNLYIWEKHFPDANENEQGNDNRRQGIQLLQNNVKSVKFTSGYIWTLTKDGKVYQWPIMKNFDEKQELISKGLGNKRQVEPLRGSIQIQTGRDHVIALGKQGYVFAMGDDTYGQCGQCDKDRNTHPPFVEKRITSPVQKNLSQITKIVAGREHNLALDKLGNLYGWGSNSNMQLSHEEQFSKMNGPLLCTYTPLKINKGLDYNEIKNMVVGDQFSVIVTDNANNNNSQVFSMGTNVRGQLGIEEIRHLRDISKIQKLSNYMMKINNKPTKVQIDQIQCGKNHCIVLLNIGYVMEWGENEYGQMGNKKRSNVTGPIVIKDFIGKKVVGVFASENNSAVILQPNQDKGFK